MAERDPKIELDPHADAAERYVANGSFETVDDVVAAAFEALDDRQRKVEISYRDSVRDALRDPGTYLDMEAALADLDERRRMRRGG